MPDVLNWEDFRSEPSNVLRSAEDKCANGNSDPFEVVEIPKGSLLSRAGALLSLEDRVAYHALCASFAATIESRLSDRVYSSRLNSNDRSFLKPTRSQYELFQSSVSEHIEDGSWVVSTDLVSYFETISHQLLFEDLKDLGIPDDVTTPLRNLLRSWRKPAHVGLPIGPDASRILGNFFLRHIDEQMLDHGFNYHRYMDDIRIVVSSEREGRAALRKFEVLCRKRGLIVTGTSKSKVEKSASYLKAADDARLDAADYALRNSFETSRTILRDLFNRAVDEENLNRRHARFALVRLGKLVDRGVLRKVVERLDSLSEISKDSAFYLRSFISEAKVQAEITAFIAKPSEPGLERYQRAWLISVMLESLTAPPSEWISYARRIALDANEPSFLRTLAFNLLARGGQLVDRTELIEVAETAHDSRLVRGAVVALKRIDRLSAETQRKVQGRHAKLAPTLTYLKSRQALPSLVQKGLWAEISRI
ncbi:RNA-directed DNA polymerase [Cellulosimicrobium cellulans]|uniref:RNA-directed DNA polymerase n=1 Tax=Cellulosimicrobium cellulans TaxID=1710 RepID=UPI0035DB8102